MERSKVDGSINTFLQNRFCWYMYLQDRFST